MKKVFLLITGVCAVLLSSCEDETAGVTTRIVTPTYPNIVFSGEQVISTNVGSGAFTDPGAAAFDSITSTSTPLQPVSNDVDLTSPGFYSVQYEAENVYGYRSNAARLVLVTPVPAADDISGTYERIPNRQPVTLTKVGTGLYVIDNIGGVPGSPEYVFPVYVGLPGEAMMEAPPQFNPLGGTVSITDGQVERTGGTITFSYRVLGSGFGTAPRTFVKVS